MDYIKRSPSISVTITRPDYSSASFKEETIVSFIDHDVSEEDKAKATEARSSALLSYNYVESLYDNESPFSLTLTPEFDENGKTWIDKIKLMDRVAITEFGKVRYTGLVGDIRYAARMGEAGPARSISIKGNGLGYILASFKIILDYHFWFGGPTAQMASDNLKRMLESQADKTLSYVLKIVYESFMSLATSYDSSPAVCGVKTLIDHFVDLDTEFAGKLKSWYEMAISLYKTGENDIWGMWAAIIPSPIYELWGRWDFTTSKYKVFARQAPFDAADWAALPAVTLHPLVLTDYDVGFSSKDVKTFFYGYAPGSELQQHATMVIDNFKDTRAIDKEKWKLYGFREQPVHFRYFKRGVSVNTTQKVLERAVKTMADWYSKNDEFLSGSISLVSIDDDSIMRYPMVGEKAKFLGGEFYIEEIERGWSYGDSPRTVLTVTRGYMYGSDGSPSGQIKNLGKRLLEFESIKHRNGGVGQ